jgi:outer membrane protein TolC
VSAAEADVAATRILVVAETTRAYADAASAAERLDSAHRILKLLDRSLHLTRRRVEIGETARIDSARIAALRNMRAADLPEISAERNAALFRLAMLTARTPAALPASAGRRTAALNLATSISVGNGAQLLARRPDVRAAERRLAAATASIGVATAELYPRISFGGSAEVAGSGVGSLLANPIGWLLGPLISWSFSDHARARARVAGAEAGSRLALAQFDGTVLRALQETETALSAYQNALTRRDALRSALDEAALVARIVRAQQREGQVDSLELLDAERTYADAQAQLIEMNGKVANAQIDLFLALGGGWNARR